MANSLWATFERLGAEEVRRRLASGAIADENARQAEAWLAQRTADADLADREAARALDREANELARDANEIALSAIKAAEEANRVASCANRRSLRAQWIAAIAAIIAAIGTIIPLIWK